MVITSAVNRGGLLSDRKGSKESGSDAGVSFGSGANAVIFQANRKPSTMATTAMNSTERSRRIFQNSPMTAEIYTPQRSIWHNMYIN
jgi:hypothetical protein